VSAVFVLNRRCRSLEEAPTLLVVLVRRLSIMSGLHTGYVLYVCVSITLHYIRIIVRKCKALQSLYKIELRVQKIKERKSRTNEMLI